MERVRIAIEDFEAYEKSSSRRVDSIFYSSLGMNGIPLHGYYALLMGRLEFYRPKFVDLDDFCSLSKSVWKFNLNYHDVHYPGSFTCFVEKVIYQGRKMTEILGVASIAENSKFGLFHMRTRKIFLRFKIEITSERNDKIEIQILSDCSLRLTYSELDNQKIRYATFRTRFKKFMMNEKVGKLENFYTNPRTCFRLNRFDTGIIDLFELVYENVYYQNLMAVKISNKKSLQILVMKIGKSKEYIRESKKVKRKECWQYSNSLDCVTSIEKNFEHMAFKDKTNLVIFWKGWVEVIDWIHDEVVHRIKMFGIQGIESFKVTGFDAIRNRTILKLGSGDEGWMVKSTEGLFAKFNPEVWINLNLDSKIDQECLKEEEVSLV